MAGGGRGDDAGGVTAEAFDGSGVIGRASPALAAADSNLSGIKVFFIIKWRDSATLGVHTAGAALINKPLRM